MAVETKNGLQTIRGLKMAVQATKTKRKLRVEIYKRLLNYTCAHPDCNSGMNIEAHHIRPLYKGGEDQFWNLIALCWTCHHKKKLHSKSEDKMLELYVYKSMHEAKILGFYMDEKEPEFLDRYKTSIRKDNLLHADEKFIYENIDNLK